MSTSWQEKGLLERVGVACNDGQLIFVRVLSHQFTFEITQSWSQPVHAVKSHKTGSCNTGCPINIVTSGTSNDTVLIILLSCEETIHQDITITTTA